MKRFMLLHIGFENPTPEIMAAWRKWFTAVADKSLENVGLRAGREISHAGTRDLPMGPESMTGYTIVKAESFDQAEAIARSCPVVSSIRVYETASH